jgi:uncharacterized protein YbjT (DUF2867 family)
MNQTSPPAASTPPVLVVGATGTVGGAVTNALIARGAVVRALVRRPAPHLTAAGVEQVVGDLSDPGAVRRALTGVSAACYVSPHSDDEELLARIFVDEANRAGVRLVFAGVHVSSRTPRSWVSLQVMRLLFASYRPKLRIGQLIEHSAPAAVIFVPTNFYDNDELFLADIVAGTYPTPMRGINRVAASDVGEVCSRALLDPGFPAGTYPVCGPRSFTGEESARVWADVLGRPVRYTGDDPVAWAAAADRRLPTGKKGRDYRASFRLLGRLAIPTSTAQVALTTSLLGRPPLGYAGYARDLAAAHGSKLTPTSQPLDGLSQGFLA